LANPAITISSPLKMNGILCSSLKRDINLRCSLRNKYISLVKSRGYNKSTLIYIREFSNLINNPDVLGIEITENNVVVYTNEIFIDYVDEYGYCKSGRYRMGCYKIVLNFRAFSIKMFNMAGPKLYCGREVEHPHVYKGDGGVCWPWDFNFIFGLFRSGQLLNVTNICIKFLKSCHAGGYSGSLGWFERVS